MAILLMRSYTTVSSNYRFLFLQSFKIYRNLRVVMPESIMEKENFYYLAVINSKLFSSITERLFKFHSSLYILINNRSTMSRTWPKSPSNWTKLYLTMSQFQTTELHHWYKVSSTLTKGGREGGRHTGNHIRVCLY